VKTLATADVDVLLTFDGRSLLLEEPEPGPQRRGHLTITPIGSAEGPAAPVPIASQVVRHRWELAGDGSRLFLLRANTATGQRVSATLSSVDISTPTIFSDLAERIGWMQVLYGVAQAPLGVAMLQDQDNEFGVLKLLLGPDLKEVIVGTSAPLFVVSPDARYTVFSPARDPATGNFSLRVADHAGGNVCALQNKPQGFLDTLDSFSDNGELVFWYEFPDPTRQGLAEGWLARSAGCADKRKFATALALYHLLRDRGLLYLDQYTPSGGGTLQLVSWETGMSWPSSGAVVIQDGVDGRYAVLEPDRRVAVFTSRRGGSAGLYAVTLP
jgi:hypothetical protein